MKLHYFEGENLRHSELDHAVNYTLLSLFGAVVFLFLFVGYAWFAGFELQLIKIGVGAILFGLSFNITSVMFFGWRKGRQHMQDVVDAFVADRNQARTIEMEKWVILRVEQTAKPTLALPSTTVPLTQNTDPKLPEMIGGFDVRDIERLCEWFAHGAKWSEGHLIGMELPITKEELTPDRYRLLIDGVFVAKGVIGGRDGEKRLTGKLLIKDVPSMMKAIHPTPSSAVVENKV